MWVQCNPNPLGKQANDCVVRAIAIATERSWGDVYADLCRMGRLECDMPSSNAVWGLFLKEQGYRQRLLPDSCPRCTTIRAFCDRFPDGTYIVGTGSHAAAIIDGSLYDSWCSLDEVVSTYWKIK